LRVGIAGFGAIGRAVAAGFADGVEGMRLVAVGARDHAKARAALPPALDGVAVTDPAALAEQADVIVECAPAAALRGIAEPALRAGRTLVVLSCGALLANDHLIALARHHGGRILVPTGALIGLDAVFAAAQGTIHSVRMTTRKPPNGLAGAPYLAEHGIVLDGLTAPLCVFEGTAREAARGFPANLNVAVALSLAGIGPDRTRLEIWADPAVSRNTHSITVDADSARLSMTIENVPSENPRTGRITALSVIALLRKMRAPLAVGT
jgi:aspartate dehydrogenase